MLDEVQLLVGGVGPKVLARDQHLFALGAALGGDHEGGGLRPNGGFANASDQRLPGSALRESPVTMGLSPVEVPMPCSSMFMVPTRNETRTGRPAEARRPVRVVRSERQALSAVGSATSSTGTWNPVVRAHPVPPG